jgi:hypothetical protein
MLLTAARALSVRPSRPEFQAPVAVVAQNPNLAGFGGGNIALTGHSISIIDPNQLPIYGGFDFWYYVSLGNVVGSTPLSEGQAGYVLFVVNNFSAAPIAGVVSGKVVSPDGNTAKTSDWTITSVAGYDSSGGVLSFVIPRAATDYRISVTFTPDDSSRAGSDEATFAAGALYQADYHYTVNRPRSPITDTNAVYYYPLSPNTSILPQYAGLVRGASGEFGFINYDGNRGSGDTSNVFRSHLLAVPNDEPAIWTWTVLNKHDLKD